MKQNKKTYKERFKEYHKDDMWGLFLKWLTKPKKEKNNV